MTSQYQNKILRDLFVDQKDRALSLFKHEIEIISGAKPEHWVATFRGNDFAEGNVTLIFSHESISEFMVSAPTKHFDEALSNVTKFNDHLHVIPGQPGLNADDFIYERTSSVMIVID
jgi:hypothetical protein